MPVLGGVLAAPGIDATPSRGSVRELTFEPTANVPQSMQSFAEAIKEAMRNASSRLPEFPVGVGARWAVHEAIAHVVPTSRVHLESQTTMVISVGTTKQPEDMSVTFDASLGPMP